MPPVTRLQRRQIDAKGPILLRVFQKRKQLVNGCDPFTLAPLERPVFFSVASNGRVHGFSAKLLLAYIDQTGDYRNPCTRERFNPVEIKRLQTIANVHGVDITNVHERETARRRALRRQHRQEYLVSMCEHYATVCVDRFMESLDVDSDSRQAMLRMNPSLYRFLRAFQRLIEIDEDVAGACIVVLRDDDPGRERVFRCVRSLATDILHPTHDG